MKKLTILLSLVLIFSTLPMMDVYAHQSLNYIKIASHYIEELDIGLQDLKDDDMWDMKYLIENLPAYEYDDVFNDEDVEEWDLEDWYDYFEDEYDKNEIELLYIYYHYRNDSYIAKYNITPKGSSQLSKPTPTPTPSPTPIPTQSKVDKKGNIIVEKEGIYADDIYFTLDGYKTILGKTTLGEIVDNTDFEVYEYLYTKGNSEWSDYGSSLSIGKKINIYKYNKFNYDACADNWITPTDKSVSISDRVVLKKKDTQILLSINNKKGTNLADCIITNIQEYFYLGQLYGSDGSEYIDVPVSDWFREIISEHENVYYCEWNFKYTYVAQQKDSLLNLFDLTLTGNKSKDLKAIKNKFTDNVVEIDDVIILKLRNDYGKKENPLYFFWTCYYDTYRDYSTTYPFKSVSSDKEYKYLFITCDELYGSDNGTNYIVIGEITTTNALMTAKERKAEVKKANKQIAKYKKEISKKENASYTYESNLVKYDNKTNTYEYNDKGKLNISQYGITRYKTFYLDGCSFYDNTYPSYDCSTPIKYIVKNTKYRIYDWNGNCINIDKDKGVYDNKILLLKNGDTSYPIGVYGGEYAYIKDMSFYFAKFDRYDGGVRYYTNSYGYPSELTSNNDYYLKKTFSIKNAPSLENFKKEFMNKLTGKGKKLVLISKLDKQQTGYKVQIPYISYYEDDVPSYLTITYKYDSNTRKCIEIDWEF